MIVRFLVKFYGKKFDDDVLVSTKVFKKQVDSSYQFDRALFQVDSIACDYFVKNKRLSSYSVECLDD